MKTRYHFCSICGGSLEKQGKNLKCRRCPFVNYRNPRPTVTALICLDNKLLLTKRNNQPFQGWWDLPGGFIDRAESPERALERELKEEIGLQIKSKKILGLYCGTYPSSFDPCYVLSIAYIVTPRRGKLYLRDKEELRDVKWFSKKDLPKKIAFDSNRRILKDFLKSFVRRLKP